MDAQADFFSVFRCQVPDLKEYLQQSLYYCTVAHTFFLAPVYFQRVIARTTTFHLQFVFLHQTVNTFNSLLIKQTLNIYHGINMDVNETNVCEWVAVSFEQATSLWDDDDDDGDECFVQTRPTVSMNWGWDHCIDSNFNIISRIIVFNATFNNIPVISWR